MDFMGEAIKQAKRARDIGEVPVGAVIVKDGIIVSVGYNMKESLKDPVAHAEIIAIKKAASNLKSWRLNKCEMYVTMEPCPMCAGAIIQSRIKKVYIGTFDESIGACGTTINLLQNQYLHTYVEVQWMYDDSCSNLLRDFFKNKRNK